MAAPAVGLMSEAQVERFAAGQPTEWIGVPGTWRLVKVVRGHIPQGRLYSAGPTRTDRGDRFRVGLYDIGKSDGLDAIDAPQIPDEGVPMIALCLVEPA